MEAMENVPRAKTPIGLWEEYNKLLILLKGRALVNPK